MSGQGFIKLILTLLFSANFSTQANERQPIEVEGQTGKIPTLYNTNLTDTFLENPSVLIHSGSELEHLAAMRSPILTGGAGAGSFITYIEGVPFRAIGYGNTNIFLGLPYEFMSQQVYLGTQSSLGNVIHGAIKYDQPKALSANKLSYLTDGVTRNRLIGTAKNIDSSLSYATVIDHSSGWRENSSFNQYKLNLKYETSIASTPVTNSFYLYKVSQTTAGYIHGKDNYKDKHIAKSSALNNGYRNASGMLLQSRWGDNDSNVILYSRYHNMNFNLHWFPTAPVENNMHFSGGIRTKLTAYESSRSKIAINWDLEQTRGRLHEFQEEPTLFGFVQGDHYKYKTRSVTSSVNFKFDKKITQKFNLTQGVRIGYIKHNYYNQIDSATEGRYKRLPSRSDDYLLLTPYFHSEYKISRDSSLKFRIEKGARSPEVNDLYRQISSQTYQDIPQENTHYAEVSFEKTHKQNHFQIDLYAMKKDNHYFRDADANNILGKTTHVGIEANTHNTVSDNLDFSIFTSAAIHRYNFDNNINDPQNISESISRRNRIKGAPSLSINTSTAYHITPKIDFRLLSRYLSSYFVDASNHHKYPGHILWDIAISYQIQSLNLSFAFRNLFDKRYAERADYSREEYRYFPGRPRHIAFNIAMSDF